MAAEQVDLGWFGPIVVAPALTERIGQINFQGKAGVCALGLPGFEVSDARPQPHHPESSPKPGGVTRLTKSLIIRARSEAGVSGASGRQPAAFDGVLESIVYWTLSSSMSKINVESGGITGGLPSRP